MARVRVDLTEPLLNGMDIKFKAPSDCTAVTGLIVYAPDNNGGISNQVFTFKDAHGNALTGLGNLFAKNALVKVMVDTEAGAAYIQNADTNKYLEDKIANAGTKVTLTDSVSTTSSTIAASATAVKTAYDRANSASSTASNAYNQAVAATKADAGTPTLSCNSGTLGTTLKSYYSVGRMCFVTISGSYTAKSSTTSDTLNVAGLPTIMNVQAMGCVGGVNFALAKNGEIVPSHTFAYISSSSSTTMCIDFAETDGTALSGSYNFEMSFVYLTA